MRLFRYPIARILLISAAGFPPQGALSQDTTRLSLLFAGDVMQHDSQIAAAYAKGQYDYRYCFQHVAPLVGTADWAIANLEVTLGGRPYKGYPQFSAPDELAAELQRAGFDVLVTANNHCLDRGRYGLERTIDVLDSLHLLHTGTFKDPVSRAMEYPLILDKNGIRLALLNYTYGTNGIPVSMPNVVNFIDTLSIATDIRKAKESSPDLIIVFFHWGNEYQSQPNATQENLARFCLQRGVQLVVGAHPHVLQPIEWDRDHNRLVAYSLGNFVSGQRRRYRDGGILLNVDLEKITWDSVSTTAIAAASYDLVWVSASGPGGYTILPVKEFETENGHWLSSPDLLRTFVSDSRQLFSKYNVNVSENDRPLIDTLYYRIVLSLPADSAPVGLDTALLAFYGAERAVQAGQTQWMIGKFFDYDIAQKALSDLKSASTRPLDARIVEFRWGVRRQETASGR